MNTEYRLVDQAGDEIDPSCLKPGVSLPCHVRDVAVTLRGDEPTLTLTIEYLHGTTDHVRTPRTASQDHASLTMVGATTGLAQPCQAREPEQVYVLTRLSHPRPVVLEGWVGYNVDSVLRLTWSQARDLTRLLTEALRYEEPGA